jgi:hypothetical protein
MTHPPKAEVSKRVSDNSSSDEPNAKFTDFVRRLVSVPHSEIEAKLEAEKESKVTDKTSTFRVPVVSSKARKNAFAPPTLPVSSA